MKIINSASILTLCFFLGSANGDNKNTLRGLENAGQPFAESLKYCRTADLPECVIEDEFDAGLLGVEVGTHACTCWECVLTTSAFPSAYTAGCTGVEKRLKGLYNTAARICGVTVDDEAEIFSFQNLEILGLEGLTCIFRQTCKVIHGGIGNPICCFGPPNPPCD